MNNQEVISHNALCYLTAKRFIEKVALYEYKSVVSVEEPDVLIFGYNTTLFEIKISLSDFRADQKKDCRKKYKLQHWAQHLSTPETYEGKKKKTYIKLETGDLEITLIEKEHLGSARYYVCPWGVIPVESLPEGWGLYYYRKGKFYLKKESAKFRPNLMTERRLAIHALRRYASGDKTGILVNTYGDDK